MGWDPAEPQGNEVCKIKYLSVPYTRGLGADVGCGPVKGFPHWIGVDNCKDVELFGAEITPDIRADADKTMPFGDDELDFVFSSHTLEHIEDYKAALAEWWRIIRPGGHLCLYLPHRDLYPRIGQPGANKDHKHDFAPEDIETAMAEIATGGWNLLENEVRNGPREYSFWQVYRKATDGQLVRDYQRPRPARTACVVRYGGFGDMMQTANVLPALKRQGFHVTVMTTPKGHDVIRHDPNVDAWLIQDDNQVPNPELYPMLRQWAERFDRFVNLCESVEGTFLALVGRMNHQWPDAVRRKRLNVNYGEFAAELAGVPFKGEGRFHPSDDERSWAEAFLLEHGVMPQHFLIVFALAGSSMHKFYPWQDNAMARVLLTMPQARFMLVGDEACQILEIGWENESRVICASGKFTIRETLTMASLADCVVGPETGVLNAVAFDREVGKVCLLSHSSVENLTKHWRNVVSLEPPKDVTCYPCHRLHYTSEFCHIEPSSGAALCQFGIDPVRVADAIQRIAKRGGHETRRVA